MAEYMLAVHDDGSGDTAAMAPEDMQALYKAVDEFNLELQAADAWVFAGGLHPPTSATTVRVTDGDVLITDGPFARPRSSWAGSG